MRRPLLPTSVIGSLNDMPTLNLGLVAPSKFKRRKQRSLASPVYFNATMALETIHKGSIRFDLAVLYNIYTGKRAAS